MKVQRLPNARVIALLLTVGALDCAAHAARLSAITMLNMTVTLDEVAPGQPGKVGDVDRLRIVYDASAVDPATKQVKLLNLQHFTGGRYFPPAPDPTQMPTDDSWLDTSSTPYRLHYKASVTHGQAIIIEFDENSYRLTIHPQQDPTATLESGVYRIDPVRITGPEAIAAGSPPAPGRK
jgi:hypothetical protein